MERVLIETILKALLYFSPLSGVILHCKKNLKNICVTLLSYFCQVLQKIYVRDDADLAYIHKERCLRSFKTQLRLKMN